MYQVRCLRPWRPSLSVISAAFMALGKSCLLAKTKRRASRSSSSFNIRWSSSRASETRSRSLESTTKMMPWVFWKSRENDGMTKLSQGREGTQRTMPPERADLVLTSNIPNSERDVLVFNGFDIESYERVSSQRETGRRGPTHRLWGWW